MTSDPTPDPAPCPACHPNPGELHLSDGSVEMCDCCMGTGKVDPAPVPLTGRVYKPYSDESLRVIWTSTAKNLREGKLRATVDTLRERVKELVQTNQARDGKFGELIASEAVAQRELTEAASVVIDGLDLVSTLVDLAHVGGDSPDARRATAWMQRAIDVRAKHDGKAAE